MEKLDGIIAAVGAAILVVAVVAAGLSGGGARSYELLVTTKDVPLDGASRAHTTDAVVRESFPFTVAVGNATRLNVTASVTFLAGPGAQGSMHVLVKAPNGTSFEREGRTTGPPLGSTQAVASAALDVPLASIPANATFSGTEEEATHAASASATTSGLGNWTIEVSFSAGPTPVPTTVSWAGVVTTFAVTPRMSVPASR